MDTQSEPGPNNQSKVDRVFRAHWGIWGIRYVSALELSVYLVVWVLFIERALRECRSATYGSVICDFTEVLITSPALLVGGAALLVVVFAFILNGVTPLVAALLKLNKPLFSRLVIGGGITRASEEGADDDTFRGTKESPRVDAVEVNFAIYVRRSQEAARIAQRRPNALLFVGTIVALAGLIFFVLTLPGSRFGVLMPEGAAANITTQDFWPVGLQLLPRLLMLIFIQVLAGFFLRQYRTSMEDFRYYESVLRYREAQYLSYTLRKRMNDERALAKFADELLKEQKIGLLARGQTTTVIETQRAEQNEFTTLYEKLAGLINRAQRASKQAPEDKPVRYKRDTINKTLSEPDS